MKRQFGFSLIELMVVVAIIGILASVAFPTYQSHVEKTRRSDAQATLSAAANAMERYRTGAGQGSYAGATLGGTGVFPDKAPLEGGDTYYDLDLENLSQGSYTIVASPEAGGPMVGDGRLEITHTGQRCWYKGADASGGTCKPF